MEEALEKAKTFLTFLAPTPVSALGEKNHRGIFPLAWKKIPMQQKIREASSESVCTYLYRESRPNSPHACLLAPYFPLVLLNFIMPFAVRCLKSHSASFSAKNFRQRRTDVECFEQTYSSRYMIVSEAFAFSLLLRFKPLNGLTYRFAELIWGVYCAQN